MSKNLLITTATMAITLSTPFAQADRVTEILGNETVTTSPFIEVLKEIGHWNNPKKLRFDLAQLQDLHSDLIAESIGLNAVHDKVSGTYCTRYVSTGASCKQQATRDIDLIIDRSAELTK